MRRPRTETRRRGAKGAAGPAFTLVELMIVMAVIAIIIAFILSAAMDGLRRSEERATQALITKLDAGVSDRLDAVLANRAEGNGAHAYMAAANGVISVQRAQLLARVEQVMYEIPDVFVVQNDTKYPLNFGAAPFPAAAGVLTPTYSGANYGLYLLPLGVGVFDDPSGMKLNPMMPTPSFGAVDPSGLQSPPESVGIFGASYGAAAGIYKNLIAKAITNGAAAPSPIDIGYNGVDDDGNGLVDDLAENGKTIQSAVVALLANHTHKTARSEMLYALLVEGQGPLGSTFSADDFNDREVRDTDGDGLPEFVDAWGEPIQFYRWPVGFASDTQGGLAKYNNIFQPRAQNPLDPNQKLVDPAWWDGTFNTNTPPYVSSSTLPLSGPAWLAQAMFFPLVDPNAYSSLSQSGTGSLWDRGSTWPARREFYSRFLILSGGPDRTPGVPVFDPAYYTALADFTGGAVSGPTFSGSSPVAVSTAVDPSTSPILPLRVEGSATQATFKRMNYIYMTLADGSGAASLYPGADLVSTALREAGNDDVTNHNISGPGGATQ